MAKTYVYKSKSGRGYYYGDAYDKDDLEFMEVFYGKDEWDSDNEALVKYGDGADIVWTSEPIK